MPTLDNPRWEQFAQWTVAGKSQREAYALAYGTDTAGGQVNAAKLMKKDAIADRIAELRRTITATLPVLTLQKKRSFLLNAVDTPVGQIDENSPLCHSYKVRTRTDKDGSVTVEKEFEGVNKLRALELDAKLAGEIGGDAAGVGVVLGFFSIDGSPPSHPIVDV